MTQFNKKTMLAIEEMINNGYNTKQIADMMGESLERVNAEWKKYIDKIDYEPKTEQNGSVSRHSSQGDMARVGAGISLPPDEGVAI